MLVYLSIIYCIVYFLVQLQFAFIINKRKIQKTDYYFLLLFFVALIFIGYHLVPSKSSDLYRHYGYVNWYRAGMNRINVKKNILPMDDMGNLYTYQFICWLVSLQKENGYLQVLYLSLDFFCVYHIVKLFTKKVQTNRSVIALFLLIYFTLTPYVFSYSGLRYSTICHIMGIGFYKYYCENDRSLLLPILYVVSIFIHPATGIFLMIQLWYEFTKKSRTFFLLIGLWGILVTSLSLILQSVPNSLISYIGQKLFYYFNDYSSKIDFRKLLIQIIFLLFVLATTYVINHRNNNTIKAIRLYTITALVGIGSVNAMFLDRVVMMMGPVLLPYLYIIIKRTHHKYILYTGVTVFAILLNVYYTITIFSYLTLSI